MRSLASMARGCGLQPLIEALLELVYDTAATANFKLVCFCQIILLQLWSKAKLQKEDIFFLIHLFARDI